MLEVSEVAVKAATSSETGKQQAVTIGVAVTEGDGTSATTLDVTQ